MSTVDCPVCGDYKPETYESRLCITRRNWKAHGTSLLEQLCRNYNNQSLITHCSTSNDNLLSWFHSNW